MNQHSHLSLFVIALGGDRRRLVALDRLGFLPLLGLLFRLLVLFSAHAQGQQGQAISQ